MVSPPRWIIASNRLPYSYDADTHALQLSSGGLVTAITGIHGDEEKVWVGAVLSSEIDHWRHADVPASKHLAIDMVEVEDQTYDRYYNGFSNDVLWPLFHYLSERVQFRHDDWRAYQTVNRLFAEKIAQIAKPNDLIWIHDFHLMLVPSYLKALRDDLTIGWFLHIPFPSSELFMELPVREALLEGVLQSDLAGFHDYGYVRHFSSTVKRILGVDTNLFAITYEQHQTVLGVFPVSIDYHYFATAAESTAVQALAKRYQLTDFVFLGVDRLDYTKGVEFKLESFYCLLKSKPELHGKVSLIQVAVPTRQDVEAYAQLRTRVEQLVSEINGQYATPTWTPIHYLYHSVSFDELLALYRAASSLVVSSRRDGMNLVALEYIASQSLADPGTVMLSEFAGAKSLLSRSVSINPHDIEGTALQMACVMLLTVDERRAAIQQMQDFLQHYTATDWGQSFMTKLMQVDQLQKSHYPVLVYQLPSFADTLQAIFADQSPCLVLDYDGTLVGICQHPSEAAITNKVRSIITKLVQYGCMVLIISGRDQAFLAEQFAGLPVYLAAEHGAMFYDQVTWRCLVSQDIATWYQHTLEIMSYYTKLVPESLIEDKSFGLAWHYRQSPAAFAQYQALKLSDELQQGLFGTSARIVHGKKVLEVCAIEANKGVFLQWFLKHYHPQAVGLIMGDDRTDEDMFSVADPERMVSIKVGLGMSSAQYRLPNQGDVLKLLQLLS